MPLTDKNTLLEDLVITEDISTVAGSLAEENGDSDENKEKKTDTENTPEKSAASVTAASKAGPTAEKPTAEPTTKVEAAKDPVQAPKAAVDAAISAAPTAEAPKTKAGLITSVYEQMSKMTTEQLAKLYSSLSEEKEKEDDEKKDEKSDDAADDEKKDDSKEKESTVKEDAPPFVSSDDKEKDDEEDDDDKDDDDKDDDEKKDEVKEGLAVLMQAEQSLSEEFKSKATELFESTVAAKVQEQTALIEANYNTRLTEEVDAIQTNLTKTVDSYLGYVVKEWVEQNKVAIEKGLRTEIAESFIQGLKGLFKESYIEVPEGKENLVDTLNGEITKLSEQLTRSTESNMKLNEDVNALRRQAILTEATAGLASTEAHKLKTLTESLDFDGNVEDFTSKVAQIKESYFGKKSSSATVTNPTDEGATPLLEELDKPEQGTLSSSMESYSSAISRIVKKL